MGLRRGRILVGTQYGKFYLRDGLVLQFALETQIQHIQLHVVVVQFVQDVEGGVVAHIELIGIQRTGRVQGIRVRVDVEIASHFAGHHVHALAQRAGRFLFAVRTVGNQVQRNLFRDVVQGIDISRITVYVALLVPTRVIHNAQ